MITHQNIGMYRTPCLFGVFTQPLKKEQVVLISIETSLTIVSTLNNVHDCMDAGGRVMPGAITEGCTNAVGAWMHRNGACDEEY